MYHTTPSVFQRLDDEGITVSETLRFYPYRATFDFECFFDGEDLPANSDRVQWIARHVPLSVSVASNVPGHETPRCYVTDGDSDKLVGTMMRGLSAISDTAFDMWYHHTICTERVGGAKGGLGRSRTQGA